MGREGARPKPRATARSRAAKGGVVLVVDDHPLWRQTLRSMLLRAKAAAQVMEASSGREAIDLIRSDAPAVVVMDIQMPEIGGIEATRTIKELAPETRVLILSSSDEKAEVLDAVRAGASGYLLKTAEPPDIVEAVRRIQRGELVFPSELTSVVLSELRSPAANDRPASALDTLTPRESAVMEKMAEGRSNIAIAKDLSLSPKTVESHVAAIFVKLGLVDSRDEHRRVAAVVRYLRAADPGAPKR